MGCVRDQDPDTERPSSPPRPVPQKRRLKSLVPLLLWSQTVAVCSSFSALYVHVDVYLLDS